MSKIPEAITIMKTQGWMSLTALPAGSENPRCMHLAIADAHGTMALKDMVIGDECWADLKAVGAVCAEQYPELAGDSTGLGAIWAVNDAPGRTFDEIERIMEKAYINRRSEIV